MKTEQFEQIVEKVMSTVRSFVQTFTAKKEKSVSSRLDALLLEKAKQENIAITLKKPVPVGKILSFIAGASLSIGIAGFLIFFVPGPWVRFIAQPQVVAMKLSNVNFTFNGVSDTNALEIESPKTIRGIQYVTANLDITPDVAVNVGLADDNRKITITPKESLNEGVMYKVTLKPGVLFSDGTYLTNEQSWVIPTKATFDIISLSPIDGATVPQDSTIEILFSTDEFNATDVASHVKIVPNISGSYSKVANRLVFKPAALLPSGNTYTVQIDGDLASTSGKKISRTWSSSFQVTEVDTDSPDAPKIELTYPIQNASEGNASFNAGGVKISDMNVIVYKMSWEEVQPVIENYIRKQQLVAEPLIGSKSPVKSWNLKGVDGYGTGTLYDYKVSLNGLPSGIYLVKMSGTGTSVIQYAIIFKSEQGIYATTRRGSKGADIWAFDYGSLKPLKDVSVSAVSCSESACTSVTNKTPDNGYVQLNSDRLITYVYSTYNDQATVLFSNMDDSTYAAFTPAPEGVDSLLAHIVKNKPIYLPGDTVKYSVILRQRTKTGYTHVPSGSKYTVALCLPSPFYSATVDLKHCVASKQVTVNNNSEINGEFPLWNKSESLDLLVYEGGTGEQTAVVASQYIDIYEADIVQAVLSIDFNTEKYVGKQQATVSGRVTDFAGAGLSGKKVDLTIGASTLFVSGDAISIASTTVTTDSTGGYSYTFALPTQTAKLYAYGLYASAMYHDGDNYIYKNAQAEWNHGDTLATSTTYSDRKTSMVPVGKNATVQLKVSLLPNEQPATSRKLNVTVIRRYSEKVSGDPVYNETTRKMEIPVKYVEKTEQVSNQTVTTGSDGTAQVSVNSVKEGYYYAQVKDTFGPWSIDEEHLLFSGGAISSLGEIDAMNEWVSEISFDREIATVGDKATLSISSSFKNTKQDLALIIETNQVDSWRYISQDTTAVDIPITNDMAGGIFVCVVHPMKLVVPNDSAGTPAGSAINSACTSLVVEDKTKELTISVTPDSQAVNPGSNGSLQVAVTDDNKQGVKSILAVSVVDKAVYQEAVGDSDPEMQYLNLYSEVYKTFKNHGSFGVTTIDARRLLNADGGRGGGGEGPTPTRKDFDTNPVWKMDLETDSQGKLSVPVHYSESITTWVVTVWAMTDDAKMGSKVIEVKTTKPVYVGIDKPGVVRTGDAMILYARVVNTTAQPFSGTLEVSCNGCMQATSKFNVSLKPYQTVDELFSVTTKDAGNYPIKAILSQNGKTIDSLEQSVAARPVGIENPLEMSALLGKKGSSLVFAIPSDAVIPLSSVSIVLSPLPFRGTQYLRVDPQYASTPEIAGALLSLGYVKQYNAASTLGISNDDVVAKAQYQVQTLLDRMQANGSFGFYSYQGEDPESSVKAAIALVYANSQFNGSLIDTATASVITQYLKGLVLSDKVSINVKTSAAYALSLYNKSSAAPLVTALHSALQKETLTNEQTLYLALALQGVGANSDSVVLFQKVSEHLATNGSSRYVSGDIPLLNSAMYLYLAQSLGATAQYKEQVTSMQQYMNASCWSCNPYFESGLAMLQYAQSMGIDQLGSDKDESVTITINGKEIQTVTTDGSGVTVRVPEGNLKIGDNTITVVTSSGRQLFASVDGTIYKTTAPTSANSSFSVTSTLVGNNQNQISNGQTAYYDITITAKQDVLGGTCQIYLPSGLRATYAYPGTAFYDYVNKYKPLYAYGDVTRSDAFQVSFGSMKKGEVIHVTLTVVGARKGTFNGDLVVVTGRGDGENREVIKGATLVVK